MYYAMTSENSTGKRIVAITNQKEKAYAIAEICGAKVEEFDEVEDNPSFLYCVETPKDSFDFLKSTPLKVTKLKAEDDVSVQRMLLGINGLRGWIINGVVAKNKEEAIERAKYFIRHTERRDWQK